MITEQQRANLATLAAYLAALPADYDGFGMRNYAKIPGRGVVIYPREATQCGTVCCAAGHGPAAGIVPGERESWADYVDRAFIDEIDDEEAWNWCFHHAWSSVDDTPHGAAQRIRYLLEHGVPEDFSYPEPEFVELYQ